MAYALTPPMLRLGMSPGSSPRSLVRDQQLPTVGDRRRGAPLDIGLLMFARPVPSASDRDRRFRALRGLSAGSEPSYSRTVPLATPTGVADEIEAGGDGCQ
jgi:hypothetical protein